MITDEQIIYDALRRYTITRQQFCEFVHEEGSTRSDGEEFTDVEKEHAIQIAKQCDRLTTFALERLEKSESPIIRLN